MPESTENELILFRLDELTAFMKEVRTEVSQQIKENRELFTAENKEIKAEIRNGLHKQMEAMRIDIAVLKTKASWWGAVWGGISGLIIAIITLMTKMLDKIGVKP